MIKMLCVASSTAFAMAFAMGGKEALSRATCGGCEKASVASASTTGKHHLAAAAAGDTVTET